VCNLLNQLANWSTNFIPFNKNYTDTPYFYFLTIKSYGCLLDTFLRGYCALCLSHYFTVDISQQDGEQKQARQQILIGTPDKK
jgi:hypothetical protein